MNNSRIVAHLSSLRRHLLSDCKKALQKVALAPAGSRGGGAEGEGEAETTLVQAEALKLLARGQQDEGAARERQQDGCRGGRQKARERKAAALVIKL